MVPIPRDSLNSSVLCRNVTGIQSLAGDFTTESLTNDSMTTQQPIGNDDDINAVIYIVVVLLFYSMGITIAIITYLKKEREESVETKAYEDYMSFRADPDKWKRYFRVQRMISHLNKVEEERKEEEERLERQRRQDSGESCGSTHKDKGHHGHRHHRLGLRFHRLSLIRKLSKESKGEKSPEIHVSLAQPELMPPRSPIVIRASRQPPPLLSPDTLDSNRAGLIQEQPETESDNIPEEMTPRATTPEGTMTTASQRTAERNSVVIDASSPTTNLETCL